MAMEPKTLASILDELDAFHKRLIAHLQHCLEQCPNERERLLLDFIIDHEEWLSSSLSGLEERQYDNALDTWFYEYTDRHAILFARVDEIPFHKMSYDAIAEKIRDINEQVIDLFQHLKERSESKSSEKAVDELLYHVSANAKTLSKETANTQGF